ncbi:MAG: TlyA family RNA methyltransferase [Actinomycetota bacterium]
MIRRRLDREMIRRGLVRTREDALRLIENRQVLVQGAFAVKPTTLIARDASLHVLPSEHRFVSRGGDKLEGALEDLGVSVEGKRCLDAGAGTGGFTDCLLARGASHVTAVDVGYGDFDWRLRNDPRVTLWERTNLRRAEGDSLGGPFGLVVADLSFISLKMVLDPLVAAGSDADFLLMVKPQFEAPRDEVGEGGIVRDPAVWGRALRAVAAALTERGLRMSAVVPSRVLGARGNQEFFVLARIEGPAGSPEELITGAVDAAAR